MNSKLLRILIAVLVGGIALPVFTQQATGTKVGELKKAEQLRGSVRRVKVETAKVAIKDGKLVEGPREVREVSTYDIRGNRVDRVSMPENASDLPGQRQYRYDDRGNVTESSLRNSAGALLLKEHYEYQFDELGNWIKMTTSIDVFEDGKLSFEPTEVTYRTITYFFDQNVANITGAEQPRPSTQSQAGPATAIAKTSTEQSTIAPVTKTSSAVEPVPTPVPSLSPNPTTESSVEPTSTNNPTSANEVSTGGTLPAKKVSAKRISESDLRAAAVDIPNPEFPVVAELSGRNRKVEVQVVVNENGDVTSARGTSAEEILNTAAEDAARKAKFEPTKLATVPTQVFSVISYDFISLPTSRVPGVTSNIQTAASNPSSVEVKNGASSTPVTSESRTGPTLSPNATALEKYQLGLSMMNEGRFAEAEEAFKDFVYRNPDEVEGYSRLALAYIAQKKNEKAIITLKVATRIKRGETQAQNFYLLGTSYNALGKYSQALDSLKQAIDLSAAMANQPDSAVSLSAIHYALGISYHGLGRLRESAQEFTKSLTIDPKAAEAYYALGMIQLSLGDRHGAEKQANLLKSLNPSLAKRLSDIITGQSVLIPSRCTVFPC